MTVGGPGARLVAHREALNVQLPVGSYRPQEIRGMEIPKPGGGVRPSGIPMAVDRLVQRAVFQVLDPLLKPSSSEASCRLIAQ